jgi:hypothetical protein
MRGLRSLFLAAAAAFAAGAYAQAVAPAAAQPIPEQPMPAQPAPQAGFFPPTPGDDPSLFHTLPPEAYVQPSSVPQAAAQPAPAAATPPLVVVVPDANLQAREQLERAQLEAQQAAARARAAPAPINGAFTGATDEADRR